METAFFILAILGLAAAAAALSLPNLIHCALCLVAVFAATAGLFLLLGAEFLSFAQVMVYVGAIAILIVFTTLVTRSSGVETGRLAVRPRAAGLAGAGLVSGVIIAAMLRSPHLPHAATPSPPAPVRAIGEELMTRHVLALEVVGLLLTAALLGAAVLALREGSVPRGKEPGA